MLEVTLAALVLGGIYLSLTRPCESRFHGHRHWRWRHHRW